MAKNRAVFGIYDTRAAVEYGITGLRAAGFAPTDVAVLVPESLGTGDLTTEKATKAPEGAATGAGTGIILGGALGWLVGIGALAIPGLGPFIAAGPILATLAGAGAGGAVGTVTGAIVGLGIPEYEAKKYESSLAAGHILLSVHCESSDECSRARDILKSTGAQDISSTSEEPVTESRAHAAKPTY